MKTDFSRFLQHRLRRRRDDTHALAARLAPLEELQPPATTEPAAGSEKSGAAPMVTQQYGAILVGHRTPRLSNDVVEVTQRTEILGFEPVVLVIVGLMIAFILFIAWLISRMPAPQ